MKRLICMVLALLAMPAVAADYTQAPGSTLGFTAKYQGAAFTGRFPSFATRMSFDPKALAASKLDVGIALAGAATGDKERDSNLRGSDFFNVAKFPQAHYVATKFRALGGNRYAADGQLSLHGVTRPVTLVFTWAPGAKPVLVGQATVKRLDFGIGGGDWSDTDIIPNEVAVTTKVVFAPAK